jgi:hypothetical protein
VGQNLLDRRAEQNSADAAALAGARYVSGATYTYHGRCKDLPGDVLADPSSKPAIKAACATAAANGYVDGSNDDIVRVDMPPVFPSSKSGLPGHVEVTISSSRASFFAGVMGATTQTTGAMAVATNDSDIPLPYSLLALDPTGCGANKITGAPGTNLITDGTVHIDSNCTDLGAGGALQLRGNGVLTAPECDVVGLIDAGDSNNDCDYAPTGVLVSGDPLKNLAPPAEPALPGTVVALDGGTIPSGCPGGSSFATRDDPDVCAFSTNAQKNKKFRIFPGLYPGGIEVTRATVYMEPGIYWIGGGGISVKSNGGANGLLISKASGDNTGTNPTGGVLIYNTSNPVTGTGYGPIHLNGGDGSTLALRPIESGAYKNMVIFVDRAAGFGGVDDIDLNGGGSTLDVTGTIYAPSGKVKLNGSSTDVVSAQVICYNFQVNGSGSAFTINYDGDSLFHLQGVGLVE